MIKKKAKAKKTRSKPANKSNALVKKYVETDTKKKLMPSLAKTGIDVLAGGLGGGIGATFGIWAVPAGILAALGGHLIGDKTGLIKTIGISAAVYGIAKGVENSQKSQETSVNGFSLGAVKDGVKDRLIDFKDNLIHAFYLNKLIGKKEIATDDLTVEGIDLDELNIFEEFGERQAQNQAYSEEKRMDMLDNSQSLEEQSYDTSYEDDEDEESESYTDFEEMYANQIDFNTI